MNKVVACGLCGQPTPMVHTTRCDRCWELERRLVAAPDIARQILGSIGESEEVQRLTIELKKTKEELEVTKRELETQKQKNALLKGMRKVTDDEAADTAMRDALGDHGQG